MNIVIESNSEKEDIKILNKIIWGNFQKRYIIYTLFLFLAAIILLIWGFQQDYTFLSAIDINGDLSVRNAAILDISTPANIRTFLLKCVFQSKQLKHS